MTDIISDESIKAYKQAHPPVPAPQWDNDACADLAAAIIREAEMGYISAKIKVIEIERNRFKPRTCENRKEEQEARRNYETAREFFHTRYFSILSLGQVEADDVVKYLDKLIERKYKHAYQSGKNPEAQAIMREFEQSLRTKEP